MEKLGIYLHKETSKQIAGLRPAPAIDEFIKMRDSIRMESTIALSRVDLSEYASVHSAEYLNKIRSKSRDSHFRFPLTKECQNLFDFIPGYEYTLGGMYSAIDLIKKGEIDRAYCWSLPGHHAYPDHGHGYCLLNPQAAAIRYAQRAGYSRILLIDWDLHQGDGSQAIFENDPSVYQISIHDSVNLYMALMRVNSIGYTDYGNRVGHCNIPLQDRQTYNLDFYKELGKDFSGELYTNGNCLEKFKSVLEELPFSPDMIFIFDGHDSHIDDCGKGITDWNDESFVNLAKTVLDVSKKHDCPVMSTTGGGYNFEVSLRLAKLHLDVLANYR
jgi:acetoin utilization deacetylase AcuC-like enzyme